MDKQEYDAIVVGSGPGGATTAKELTLQNKKVLILEWGKNAPVKGNMLQALSSTSVPGKSMLLAPDLTMVFRGISCGGSTVNFYATAFDPPVEMFKKYGVDISQEVEEVRNELPVKPLDDSLLGPMAKRIMSSARDLGYDWQKMPKFIYQDKCKPDCWRCSYGCPWDAKWSAKLFVNQALENGATVIDKAKVERVLTENGKAIGVEYKKGGAKHRVYAPKVVISAGGIGTPAILNASGIRGSGEDFFYDPLIAVMGTVKDIKGGKEIPMAAGIHMEEEGYMMTDMTMPGTLFRVFAAQVLKLTKLLSHSKTLTIMVKAKDDLSGRLSNKGGVRKRLAQEDKKKMMKGFERAKTILNKAGAKDVYKSCYLASHPGGTAKIGQIIDQNLETEIENLFVCDCSVIPEAWGLPPTFTLVSLAKRLSKHIA